MRMEFLEITMEMGNRFLHQWDIATLIAFTSQGTDLYLGDKVRILVHLLKH